MKLRAGCEVKEDQKMNRSHHRSTPGGYTALSNGHMDIGNWERPRRSASVFGEISCIRKFMQFYMILPDRAAARYYVFVLKPIHPCAIGPERELNLRTELLICWIGVIGF